MTFHQQEKNVPMLMMIFLMVGLMTVQKTQGFLISLHSSPVTAMGVKSTRRIISTTRRNLYEDEKNRHSMDSVEAAEPLPLSIADLQRLTEMKTRSLTMPIVILDALVPGQRLSFQSGDPKFHKLIDYALNAKQTNEIGMIGFNPHTGKPLNMGVTLDITKDTVLHVFNENNSNGAPKEVAISARGKRRFEVVGEPWLDESGSFYLANVDIVDQRQEEISSNHHEQAKELYDAIPSLVQEWTKLVLSKKKSTLAGMNQRLQDIGPMPQTSLKDRAIWVAALVNPIPAMKGVCLEIRPAMLSCRNDHDRMVLASTALRSSIDHMSGKHRLF